MRASIGTRHVRVGGHVPGPISMAGGILSVPFLALTAVITIITAVLQLIGWLAKVLWWVVVKLILVVGCVLLAVTAPIWWPARGWWRHHNKVLVRKVERRQHKNVANSFAQPPTGARVG